MKSTLQRWIRKKVTNCRGSVPALGPNGPRAGYQTSTDRKTFFRIQCSNVLFRIFPRGFYLLSRFMFQMFLSLEQGFYLYHNNNSSFPKIFHKKKKKKYYIESVSRLVVLSGFFRGRFIRFPKKPFHFSLYWVRNDFRVP